VGVVDELTYFGCNHRSGVPYQGIGDILEGDFILHMPQIVTVKEGCRMFEVKRKSLENGKMKILKTLIGFDFDFPEEVFVIFDDDLETVYGHGGWGSVFGGC
jgi:hypothetical protein